MAEDLGQVAAASVGIEVDMGSFGKSLEVAKQTFDKAVEGLGLNFSTKIEEMLGEGAAGFIEFSAAAVAAIAGVTAAITAMAIAGSKKSDVEETFQTLTAGANLSADALINRLQTATKGTIGDFELMKTVNKDLAAGMKLTQDQYGLVGEASRALAKATGGDETEAWEKINQAMLTGRTRQVEVLTGKIDIKAAEEKYAAQLGVTVDSLTEEGKVEAKREAILTNLQGAMGRLGDQQMTFGEKVRAGVVSFENFIEKLEIGIARSPVLAELLDAVQSALSSAFGGKSASMVDTIVGWVNKFAIGLTVVADIALTVAGIFDKTWNAIETVVLAVETAVVGLVDGIVRVLEAAEKLGGKLHLVDPSEVKNVSDLRTNLDGMTVSLAQQTKEAALGAIGQSAFSDKLGQMQDKLGELRTKMIDSANTVADHTEKQDKLNKSLDNTPPATGAVTEAVKKYIAAWKELNSVGTDVEATVNAIDGKLVDQVEYYLKAGASVSTIAAAYSDVLTPAQVDAIDKLVKGTEKYAKAWDDAQNQINKTWDEALSLQHENSLRGLQLELAKLNTQEQQEKDAAAKSIKDEDQLQAQLLAIDAKYDELRGNAKTKSDQTTETKTKQLWNDYYATVNAAAMNSTQYEIAQTQKWYQDKVAEAKAAGIVDQTYFDALEALANAKMQKVYEAHDQTFQGIKILLNDLQNGPGGFVETFSTTLAHTGSFGDAFESVWKQVKKDVEDIFGSLLNSIISGFLQPLLDNVKSVAASVSSMLMKALGGGGGSSGGGGFLSGLFGGGGDAGGASLAGASEFDPEMVYGSTAATPTGGLAGAMSGISSGFQTAVGAAGHGLATAATFLATNPIGWAIDGAIGAALLWNHFSGPNQKELEGRDAVKQWESDVWSGLSPAQKQEASASGFSNPQDAGALIWMRTAFQNMGRPDPEKSAEAYMQNVWGSITKGHTGVVSAIEDVTSFAGEGFASSPQLAMIGDAPGEKGEYVLHESTVRNLARGAAANSGGGLSGSQTIIMMLDKREIARVAVRGFPREIRMSGAAK